MSSFPLASSISGYRPARIREKLRLATALELRDRADPDLHPFLLPPLHFLPPPSLLPHQSQKHTFTWSMIANYEADLEEQAFTFQYSKDGRDPSWVKVYSTYVSKSM